MSEPALHREVVVVGSGVVGSAIARELSRFELRCTLVEAGPDVGAGTSKANTALLHTGFDATPGTLEARLVRRGHELLSAYAAEVGIPLARTGALLVAWSDEQHAAFPGIVERARANGHEAIREVEARELAGDRASDDPRADDHDVAFERGLIHPSARASSASASAAASQRARRSAAADASSCGSKTARGAQSPTASAGVAAAPQPRRASAPTPRAVASGEG